MVLACTVLAFPTPATAQEFAAASPAKLSRFQRTILFLQHSPPLEQRDFAATALAELAAVYMAEADLARSDAALHEGGRRARLLSWSLAVDQYASQLLLVLEDLELGLPLTLRPSPQGPVTIAVADRALMLGHPRADQQAAYEQQVLSEFCSRHDCLRMTLTTQDPEPIPLSALRVNPLWTFTETGPVCSIDGLEVHFGSTQNLAFLRSVCEELIQEVAALATDLTWQRRHGVEIDWQGLAITSTPARPEHLVRLNAAGDSVLLTVPLLFGSPELLTDITPLLYGRAMGQESASVRLEAAKYGWLPPAP